MDFLCTMISNLNEDLGPIAENDSTFCQTELLWPH